MMTADTTYGPIGSPFAGLTPRAEALDPRTTSTRAGGDTNGTKAPPAGRAAELAADPTFWLMVTIGLAVLLASYAATGKLPTIDIDLK